MFLDSQNKRKCGGTLTLANIFDDMESKQWVCKECGNTLKAKDVLNLENE